MKLKDKKIEIWIMQGGKNPEGFPLPPTFTPIAQPLWAYFRQLSGKEVFAAQSVLATEEVLFIINWRTDVTTRHIVRFRSVDYDITRVDVFEEHKGDIALYAKRRG
ncbi:MAG: phage head closure protein [Oscillospiraceae bacterium]|nr:phage head closure protein [Oscillospiraceae bacterium]